MRVILKKAGTAASISMLAMLLVACGGKEETGTDNVTTTEMLSTETTLDGTTNDATSMDVAAGMNNEVALPTNETASENSTAE